MMLRCAMSLCLLAMLTLISVQALGQSRDGGNRPKGKAAITVTPEREAAVLTFVQRNHGELADLLRALRDAQPAEYERAIKEIFRTTERLAQIQERDPQQYELEI